MSDLTNNLTIQSKSSSLAFTGNELVYKIKTTNRFSVNGSPPIILIQISDPGPVNDEILTIEFMDHTLVFTFKDSPDESGLQLPTNPGVSLANYLQLVIDALKANYLLSKYYKIFELSGDIRIESKAADSIFKITVSDNATNLSTINVTNGIDSVENQGYKIMVRPVIEGDVLGEERIPVYENGGDQIGKIGISDYLKHIGASFPFPGETGTVIYHSPDLKKCWIEYAEYYENSVKKIFSSKNTDYMYTLKGGLDTRKIAKLNEAGTSVFEYIRDRKDFLTNRPLYNKVLLNQHEILSYVNLDSQISTINVVIHAWWRDGTEAEHIKATTQTQTFNLFDFDVTPFRLEMENWHTGPSPLNMEALIWRTPYKYKVWLEDGAGNMLTVGRTYEIVEKNRYDHQFIFRNSYGRYDTVRLTGKAERGAEVEREVINHNRSDADLAIRQFQQKQSNAQEQQSLKVNTGYLDKVSLQPDVYRDYLRELQMSREVYEIVNGELYPSLVESSRLVSQKNGEQLQYVEFEIIRAYTDEHYVRDQKLIPDQFFTPEFNYRFVQ